MGAATGTVVGPLHRRHRAEEFRKSSNKLDREVSEGLEVHLICDNHATHKTPAIKRWLLTHPRFHIHSTPTSASWLNLGRAVVRRADLQAAAARGAQVGAGSGEGHPFLIQTWNEDPRPFVWRKTAEEILGSLAPYCRRIKDSGH